MQLYLAPMEGITGYIYRNAYHSFFYGADKYFTPFLMPSQNKSFNSREMNEILPEHNVGKYVVPQLLTNRSGDFIQACRELKEMGYGEVNLNLGCPSRTVVSKNRGSGFLACQKQLDQFLEEVFGQLDIKISIKTRIGRDAWEEFYELIEIFNKYPLEELIIHPRIQKDFYKSHPNWEVFEDGLKLSKNPVCYNGDIFTLGDFKSLKQRFPAVEKVMAGRGILSNPGLIGRLRKEPVPDKKVWRDFHDNVCNEYQKVLFGDKNLLFKMKELWSYLSVSFTNGDKYAKKIRKCEKLAAYEKIVDHLFQEEELCIRE